MPLNLVVTEPYHAGTALLEEVTVQQRVDASIQSGAHVLQQHRPPQRQGKLPHAHEVGLLLLDHYQIVGGLHAPHPLVGLALRVNAKAELHRVGHHNGVCCREVVLGEPVQVPLLDLHWVPQRLNEGERLTDWQTLLREHAVPLLQGSIPEVGGEGAKVGHHPCRQQCVADELDLELRQALGGLCPAAPLTPEPGDEGLCAIQLLRA
mmetsp:Transcript_13252/g.37456  ORF Transcript_13252/g.37456 Transcript_13252/m.37456 type:complete len:207 (-) Transcript_13252:4661-5281(-)